MSDSFVEENFNQQEISEHLQFFTKRQHNTLNISIPRPSFRDRSKFNSQMGYTNQQLTHKQNKQMEQDCKPVKNQLKKASKKYIMLDNNKNKQNIQNSTHHFRFSLLSAKNNKKQRQQLKSLSFTANQNVSKSKSKNTKLQNSKQINYRDTKKVLDKHYKISKRQKQNNPNQKKKTESLLTPKTKTDKLVAQKFMKEFQSVILTLQYQTKIKLNIEEVRNILIHMRFLCSDKQNKTQHTLVEQLYKCLGGQINKGIKRPNLIQLLLVITGISINQKYLMLQNNQKCNQNKGCVIPYQCRFGIIVNKKGNIQLNEVQSQKIQTFFDLFFQNRLASRNKLKINSDIQKQNYNYTPKINKNAKNLTQTYRGKVLNKKKLLIPEVSKASELQNYIKIMQNNNNQILEAQYTMTFKDTIINEQNSSIINDFKSMLKSDTDIQSLTHLRNHQQKLNYPKSKKNPLFVMQIHVSENIIEQMMIYEDQKPNIEYIVNEISRKYKIEQYEKKILTQNLKSSLKQYKLNI